MRSFLRVLRSRIRSDDCGQMGGIEALPFGVLIFVVGSLLIANAWAVVDAKFVTTSAAREAARTYVEADDGNQAAYLAGDAARRAVTGHGRDPSRVVVEITHADDRPFQRCTRITASATYTVPAISLPFIGGYGEAFTVTSEHSEIVDPFRDGLPVGGGC
jgi:hypothetical protein